MGYRTRVKAKKRRVKFHAWVLLNVVSCEKEGGLRKYPMDSYYCESLALDIFCLDPATILFLKDLRFHSLQQKGRHFNAKRRCGDKSCFERYHLLLIALVETVFKNFVCHIAQHSKRTLIFSCLDCNTCWWSINLNSAATNALGYGAPFVQAQGAVHFCKLHIGELFLPALKAMGRYFNWCSRVFSANVSYGNE